MDSDEDSDNPPPTHIRWFHAGHGLAHLDLLATPIPVLPRAASAPITSWTAFTREESDCCEAAWHALSDEQRASALAGDPGVPVAAPLINDDDEVSQSNNVFTTEHTSYLYVTGGTHTRYPYWKRAPFRGRSPNATCTSLHLTLVNHPQFETQFQMYCVYWKITGPPIPVLRGAWMYDQVIIYCQRVPVSLLICILSIYPEPSCRIHTLSRTRNCLSVSRRMKSYISCIHD